MQETVDLYDVAVYLRLSRDDGDIDGSNKIESNSITSQRDLVRSFVRDNPQMQIYDIYVDDGFSGSNFERPEFKRMIQDIESRKVNCVIVKDLSRFGRDYIEAGRFIQKIFPALSVRFIAITDNYDSLTADKADSSLILPVKNFVNDSYCRDISMKVKSHQKIKRMNGEFIGAFAVYGYSKAPQNKTQLIVDEYAADIVKQIFNWKIDGMSSAAIANKLDELHILSPMEYKLSMGFKYNTGFKNGPGAKWSSVAVKRILMNQVYIGNLEQGKKEKINYKVNKMRDKPQSEWICVPNTHEPIITTKNFNNVQRLLKYDGRASADTGVAHMFTGLLFCADCKSPMKRRVNKYKGVENTYYICATKNKSLGCSRHSIEEDKLSGIVLKTIQKFVSAFIDAGEIAQYLKTLDINYNNVVEYDLQIFKLQEEYNKYCRMKTTLLEDLKEGLIVREEYDDYRKQYQAKCDELQHSIESQKNLIKNMFKNGVASSVAISEMKATLEIKKLDRLSLVNFVDKVWVLEDKKLVIDFLGVNEFEKLQMMQNMYSEIKKCTRGNLNA